MISSKVSLLKPKPGINLTYYYWNISRGLSDQQLGIVTSKERTSSFTKLEKKPSRPPFIKNLFLGLYDSEMLAYPEIDKARLEELEEKIIPYESYFRENVDAKVLSSSQTMSSEMKQRLSSLGLFGQVIPSAYGGSDQTAVETALISEIIAKNLDIALMLYSHNFLGVQTLVKHGSEQQKAKYLPKLASGEWIAAFCMSEGVTGSDLACLETSLVPSESNPGTFSLNGKKQWVINGTTADLFIVLAKKTFNLHTGQTLPGLQVLLVEKDAIGVSVSKPLDHMGLNAAGVCEVNFVNTPVNSDSLIGNETSGFIIWSDIVNSGRYNLGAFTVSVLKKLLNKASDFIVSRKQLDMPLYKRELIHEKFAEIATCIYTLESMVYHTAFMLDIYDKPDVQVEQAIIKVFSFTEGRYCLDLIMELMGGRAFLQSEDFQKYFRDFRTMEVVDGTVDIAKLFIVLVGLEGAGKILHGKISKLRTPFHYPGFAFKHFLFARDQAKDQPKLNLNLFEELHPSLTESANEMEYCVHRLKFAVTTLLHRYGSDFVNQQTELLRLTDAAIKIYAMTCVLARASRSYCIGLPFAETEMRYALNVCHKYKRIVQTELNDLLSGLALVNEINFKMGPDILEHHGYFVKSPLERTF